MSGLRFLARGAMLLTLALVCPLLAQPTANGILGSSKTLTHGGVIWAVASSPDGRSLASGGQDRQILIWDHHTGEKKTQIVTESVVCLTFSPDGKILSSAPGGGCRDYSVRLWDPQSGKEIRRLEGHQNTVYFAAFSPDGKRLVSGGVDMTVRVWDTSTGKEIFQIKGHTNHVLRVAFSSDNRTIASVGDDETVRLWDVETGKSLHRLQGHTGQVTAVAFSANGRLVASGGGDGSVRLWEVATGRQLWENRPRAGLIQAVAFLPDGRSLGVGTGRGSIHLLETATGLERARFSEHTANAYGLSVVNRQTLASASGDGTIKLWNVRAPLRAGLPAQGPYTEAQQELLWQDLASADAVVAYRAVNSLSLPEGNAFPFLASRARPRPPATSLNPGEIETLINRLDDEDFSIREEASAALRRHGALVEKALVLAQGTHSSFEVRRRARHLLEALGPTRLNPEELRLLRIGEVLERLDTPEARNLAEKLR